MWTVEYFSAENQAYQSLIKNGYKPEGRTQNLKHVVVFDKNEKPLRFKDWQEAVKELCTGK